MKPFNYSEFRLTFFNTRWGVDQSHGICRRGGGGGYGEGFQKRCNHVNLVKSTAWAPVDLSGNVNMIEKLVLVLGGTGTGDLPILSPTLLPKKIFEILNVQRCDLEAFGSIISLLLIIYQDGQVGKGKWGEGFLDPLPVSIF